MALTLARRRTWRASLVKVARRIGGDEFLGESDSDDARAEHKHVHIVVLDALMRGINIVAHGGADAFDFVGGDGGAGCTATTDENTSFRLLPATTASPRALAKSG